jgi:DNA invertase Pin-like site-specific DNA recombinase
METLRPIFARLNRRADPRARRALRSVERDLIRTRTAEGRSRAKKRGQRMGRPSKLTDAQKVEARRRRAQGATLAELARSYHVGKSTISRL